MGHMGLLEFDPRRMIWIEVGRRIASINRE
jgi:hypothetical protein